MNWKWLFCLPLLILSPTRAGALSAYQVETIGPCTNTEVSDAMRDTLQPQGLRVVGNSGVLCDVWLRKTVPQKAGSTGAEYSTLANGTLVGVITYSLKAGDYRGQAVRAGTYTLRYQTIPQDGNHLGVAPSPNFFLLSPAAEDKDPNAAIDFAELVILSKKASGTNHPNPLQLASPTGAGASLIRGTDEGHWVLESKTKAQPAGGGTEVDLPVAVILVGKAEG